MLDKRKRGAGIGDKLTLRVIPSPQVRITNITQETLRRLILNHIKDLPKMRGFKILTAREDDGIQFIQSISSKGAKSRGRQPELMIVHFEVMNPKRSRLVVSQGLWARVEALRRAIMLSPQLKSLDLKVYDRIYWSDYDLEDDLPPRKFAFTIEFYPPEQDELEKRMAALGREYAENRTRGALREALKTPAIIEEIKQCVK